MSFYEIIINQLGGIGKLTAMVNARSFAYNEKTNSLTFKFSGFRKANICRITLEPTDTYKVELIKIGKLSLTKPVTQTTAYEAGTIYADALKKTFEEATGLYLSI